jgi:oligopeptide/dipeptide ABC transporter ATP-binding protein
MPDTTSDKPPAITLARVTRRYMGSRRLFGKARHAITALDNVDLTIAPGEFFGLVGESGSGKTTAARLIVRLEKPDGGAVRHNGEDIATLRGKPLSRFRQRVQMIFQDPYQSLNPYQSVQSIVVEPLNIHRWGTRTARHAKVMEVLEQVGLTPPVTYLRRYPHQLSGGQRQRVAIARAMVLDPNVLVADEPTSMLDASIAIQIYGILADIQKRRQVTMLFITHSLAAAHFLCNRIAVLYRGHIVETGPVRKVIANPRHPYTQALLDALPKFGHLWSEKRFNTLRAKERPGAPPEGCPFYSRCVPADDSVCCAQRPAMQTVHGSHEVCCFLGVNNK